MAKVVLINLQNFSYNEIEITLENDLLPVSLPVLSALTGKVKNNNFVVISRGLLGGKHGVGLSDALISAISPQSKGIIESKIQGRLASSIHALGVDAIVLINKADSLTGVEITNREFLEFNFPKAKKLKGLSVWKTTEAVKTQSTLTTLAIGEAGEKKYPGSSIVCDNGFATSQGGLGAVFGQMNLKYISLAGAEKNPTNPVIESITRKYASGIQDNPLTKSEHDAPGFGLWANSKLTGYMAGNNFGRKLPAIVNSFDPNKFLPYLKDNGENSCPGCPQNCLKSFLVSAGPTDGGRQHQLSITSLLSQYGEGSTEELIDFNSYCHEIGVEHVYTAALLIQENIKLKRSIKKRVDKVKKKELKTGFNQIKGMAIPPWDPRGSQGLALAMALNPSGPRYDVIEHDIDFDPNWVWHRHVEYGGEYGIPKGGIALATLNSDREKSIGDLWLLWSALDALGVCIYSAPPTRELRSIDVIEMVKSELNRDVTMPELFELGLMRLAIQRDINQKLGLAVDKDNLPDLFFNEQISDPSAALNGAIISESKFKGMKSAIIKRLGWIDSGGVDKTSVIWQKCEVEIGLVQSKIAQLCE